MDKTILSLTKSKSIDHDVVSIMLDNDEYEIFSSLWTDYSFVNSISSVEIID